LISAEAWPTKWPRPAKRRPILQDRQSQDEFFLVSFNERAELTSLSPTVWKTLQSRMMLTAPKGRTALLDAIYLGLSQMRGAHNAKRALLILSDWR